MDTGYNIVAFIHARGMSEIMLKVCKSIMTETLLRVCKNK